MCGITGMVHLEQDLRQQELLLRKMQRTLQRRGPDQEGIFLSPQCAMAHTRLAVIDGEKGRQPMEVTAGGETYTIVYNGEAYFEDKIFALSDEQKELAENYAQNLSVFLGDGMMQGLLPAESADLVSLGDIRFSDGATQVVYYNQLDKR